ncbi:hypothetical protein V1525DRAFT_410906 [Lipomyces kononenkoae]|uniref:Uncharacterized protein n=1 Tax=Lipomyces kononenkoae TaxID=34357 RepID=A0ACC3SU31_LIPKO
MKLIVAGATGFVGKELIRQAVSHPGVTSIVSLARRATPVPQDMAPGADLSKLKSVVCDNFEDYPESVKKELSGADACIWLIAVTPSKSWTIPWEQARKVCYDYTVKGLETIAQLPRDSCAARPLRFIYTSGAKAERDPSKKPWLLGDYSLMRGEAESIVLNYAKESKGAVEAAVAKPGLIDAPGKMSMAMNALATIGRSIIGIPKVDLSEVAATLIDQAINGIEKDTLLNDDLVRIGQKALAEQQKIQ